MNNAITIAWRFAYALVTGLVIVVGYLVILSVLETPTVYFHSDTLECWRVDEPGGDCEALPARYNARFCAPAMWHVRSERTGLDGHMATDPNPPPGSGFPQWAIDEMTRMLQEALTP